MLVRLKNALLGGARITVTQQDSQNLLNFCLEMKLPVSQTKLCDERFTFTTSYRAARALARRLKAQEIEFSESCFGFPFFLWAYRKRPGIFIGLALAVAIIFVSGSVVWDIRVSGNSSVDTATVKRELASAGFDLGSSVKTDVDRISNSLLSRSDKISWLSINMSGTVAYVQIREAAHFVEKENAPCNLVASKDGTVERIESSCGTVCVAVGQSVKKGEILVSGVRGGKLGNYTLVQASGEIFAITSRDFFVEIPLQYEAQVLTSVKKGEKHVKFFAKNIFFSKNSRKNTPKCVKIYMEENLSPPSLPPLPFGVVTELIMEYKTVTETRTQKEASDMAFAQLYRDMASALADSDLMSKNIRCEMTDDSVRLYCTAVCSENIAVPQKIQQ